MTFEDGLAHAVERELDRRAVAIAEGVEQRVADGGPRRLELPGALGVLPARRDDRGQDPIVGLRQGRVLVADEALPARGGRLEDEQVVDARFVGDP
jgi:hypothetical protein